MNTDFVVPKNILYDDFLYVVRDFKLLFVDRLVVFSSKEFKNGLIFQKYALMKKHNVSLLLTTACNSTAFLYLLYSANPTSGLNSRINYFSQYHSVLAENVLHMLVINSFAVTSLVAWIDSLVQRKFQ